MINLGICGTINIVFFSLRYMKRWVSTFKRAKKKDQQRFHQQEG